MMAFCGINNMICGEVVQMQNLQNFHSKKNQNDSHSLNDCEIARQRVVQARIQKFETVSSQNMIL